MNYHRTVLLHFTFLPYTGDTMMVACRICSKEFYVKPSHKKLGYGKFCSRRCQHQGQRRGKHVACAGCGEKIWRTPKELKRSKSKKFFCSKTCQTKWRNQYYSGKRHPNWNGGYYQRYKAFLISEGIPQECNMCGTKDVRVLSVHHKDGNHRNNVVSNLVWLCLNCHHLTHHYKM